MSETINRQDTFPRKPLIGAVAVVGFALMAALFGRADGLGRPALPPGQPTAQRSLTFADRSDGAVVVRMAATGRVLTVMVGQNGFLRGTLRGFARTRRADDIGRLPPFVISGYQDGRLTLTDPSTGRIVELEAFGSANEAVFVRLLTMAPPDQTAALQGPADGSVASRAAAKGHGA